MSSDQRSCLISLISLCPADTKSSSNYKQSGVAPSSWGRQAMLNTLKTSVANMTRALLSHLA